MRNCAVIRQPYLFDTPQIGLAAALEWCSDGRLELTRQPAD